MFWWSYKSQLVTRISNAMAQMYCAQLSMSQFALQVVHTIITVPSKMHTAYSNAQNDFSLPESHFHKVKS